VKRVARRGFEQSGIGREAVRAALDPFTESNSVMIAV
jgi:acyl-CoA reductase-like NAD-dependent aldehyde dehydrogenase